MTTVLRLPMRVFAATLAMIALCSSVASAASWNWHIAAPAGAKPGMETTSSIVLSAQDVVMTYSVHVANYDIPTSSCRAHLSDVAAARVEHLAIGNYFFVAMKPHHMATCSSGSRASALVPIGTDSAAGDAVSSVLRACCESPSVTVAVRPTAAARPTAAPTPSASPSSTFIPPLDWIENAGIFAFVRVRNRDGRPLTIVNAEIGNCRDVVSGCGPLTGRALTLPPRGIATLATVMSGSAKGATFSYNYTAISGAQHVTGGGTSTKASSSDANIAMKAWQIREAEAAAIAVLGSASTTSGASQTPPPAPPAYVAARLTQRGTTRLGIGQRGVAVVRVSLSASGKAQNATIVSITNHALEAAATEVAVSSTYAPAMRNGRAESATYLASFQFDGEDPALSSTPVWRRPVSSAVDATLGSPGPVATPTATPSRTPAEAVPPKVPPAPGPSPAAT